MRRLEVIEKMARTERFELATFWFVVGKMGNPKALQVSHLQAAPASKILPQLVHKFAQMSPRNAHKHSTLCKLCNRTDLSDRSTSICGVDETQRSWALQTAHSHFFGGDDCIVGARCKVLVKLQ